MNKRKRVAWHKHLVKNKKKAEKRKAQKATTGATPTTARR